jgi:hypothetical protein
VHYVLEWVALEVKRLHVHLPEKVNLARAALAAEERRVVNYIAFIGEGKGTRALTEALQQAEHKVDALRGELQVLTATVDAAFQVPSLEWVAERLSGLQKLGRSRFLWTLDKKELTSDRDDDDDAANG